VTTDLRLEQRLKMSGVMPPTPICGQYMHRDYFLYEQYKIFFQKLWWSIMIFSYFCKKKNVTRVYSRSLKFLESIAEDEDL